MLRGALGAWLQVSKSKPIIGFLELCQSLAILVLGYCACAVIVQFRIPLMFKHLAALRSFVLAPVGLPAKVGFLFLLKPAEELVSCRGGTRMCYDSLQL